MLSNKLFSSISNTDRLYVDDVFSAYTYTGNGSTQTINNGIDLAGKGGLVWKKARNGTWGTTYHHLVDTARGTDKTLSSNATDAENPSSQTITAFNSNGFTLGSSSVFTGTGSDFVSWTFRKAPKFFDVVTYTGDGTSSKTISHSLGSTPGMIVVKGISAATDWPVYHRMSNGGVTPEQWYTRLNSTAAQTNAVANFGNVAPTSSVFTVGGNNNASGIAYVAYLFAHDTSADGLIQCGSFTTDGSGNATVSLGWEPQFVLTKCISSSEAWKAVDVMRGFANGGGSTFDDNILFPNASSAESASSRFGYPSASGFGVYEQLSSVTCIYLAIRRPNKPPTTGTQVYNAIARTGTGAAATVTGVGFAPDCVIYKSRSNAVSNGCQDRLRGGAPRLSSASTASESSDNELDFGVSMDGTRILTGDGVINFSGWTYINHFFKRAPGFFDVVCYTGTGAASQLITHSLAVSPELVIIKRRNDADSWMVYASSQALLAILNQTNNFGYNPAGRFSGVSASTFTISSDGGFGANGGTYVAYLFASLPGISKVGSYTGNGSSQTINCGFSTGARFILLKRTDSTGDWYVWDTARGIIAANDPHLSLNTASAEVTTNDSVDPASTGFIVNQVADTNINVNGATYIFLSIA